MSLSAGGVGAKGRGSGGFRSVLWVWVGSGDLVPPKQAPLKM